MKRKTTDTPCRIYSYRVLPPVTERDRVEDQFRQAHHYRNALVAVERDLFAKFRELQLADPHVGPVLVAYEEAQAAVDETINDIRAAKTGNSKADLSAFEDPLEASKELRNVLSDELRALKKARAEDLKPHYDAAHEWAKTERKKRRGEFILRGLRHGTYVRIEDGIQRSVKQSKQPPKFERMGLDGKPDSVGSIGIQLQESSYSGGAKGMTVAELHGCTDTRLRIQPLPDTFDFMRRNHRRHAARVTCWIRIGSSEKAKPIFAEFPLTMHRPLPKDAVVKWAYIVRYRVGIHWEWRLQLTVESEMFRAAASPTGSGMAAIDLGWRRVFDDEGQLCGIRTAMVVDDAGNKEEVFLPAKVWQRIGKCEDLAQIRDKSFDRMRDALVAWLKERAPVADAGDGVVKDFANAPASNAGDVEQRDATTAGAFDVPDNKTAPTTTAPASDAGDSFSALAPQWLLETTPTLHLWRAIAKLAWLVDQWQKPENRFPGDEQMLESLRAWAKQDRHLHSWQAHQRDRLLAHRREVYRVTAARLARTYATLVFEDGDRDDGMMDLTKIDGWDKPEPNEGNPSDGRDQRYWSRLCAPGELRAAIIYAAKKNGCQIETARTEFSTLECNACGHEQEHMDARRSIEHTCESCGVNWDQDVNAGMNLLKRFRDENDEGGDRSVAGMPRTASRSRA